MNSTRRLTVESSLRVMIERCVDVSSKLASEKKENSESADDEKGSVLY